MVNCPIVVEQRILLGGIILRSVKKNNSPDDNHGAALLEHFDLAFHPTYTPGFQVNLKFQWPENRGSKLDDIIKH